MDTCYIACALDCKIDFKAKENDLIIGADRGYLVLKNNGIEPQIALGDFDSYKGAIDCKSTIRYPSKKDFTDCELAIKCGIERGYRRFRIFGAIGGLLDHTIASLSLLGLYSKNGYDIAFVDGDNVAFAITNSSVLFSNDASGRISVFAFDSEVAGVCEEGLMYELDNVTLKDKIPLGVSNEFVGNTAKISVKKGTLLLYTSKENFEKHLTSL